MSDGNNERRAVRVAEIMNDYRNLQHYIAQIRSASSNGDKSEEGYQYLLRCSVDAEALLTANFNTGAQVAASGPEAEKAQLQRIMVDASLRRFQAQRILQRATAATRWINARTAVLQGQKPHPGNIGQLQQIDNQSRGVSA
ncbi:MAG: hypothetical protein M1814_001201 [Vezdaea aestivalis]|nr:MAG: hypothetical protein M1814_001201 [Vezdaea aestivalis]